MSSSYSNVDDLEAAYVGAGGQCSGWAHGTASGHWAAYGTCGGAGYAGSATLAIYTNMTGLSSDVLSNQALSGQYAGVLVGPNWIILADSLDDVQTKLGGTIVPLPAPTAVTRTATPVPTSTPTLTDADRLYLQLSAAAGRVFTGGDASAISTGHNYCDQTLSYYKSNPDKAVSALIENSSTRDEPAIQAYCPQYLPALNVARGGFGDGHHAVVDAPAAKTSQIAPGDYVTIGPVTNCYWERATGSGDIIDNDFVSFAPDGLTLTVNSGEGLTTQGCGTWLHQ